MKNNKSMIEDYSGLFPEHLVADLHNNNKNEENEEIHVKLETKQLFEVKIYPHLCIFIVYYFLKLVFIRL